jgi:hypothetical protein
MNDAQLLQDIEDAKDWSSKATDPDGQGWRPAIGRLAKQLEFYMALAEKMNLLTEQQDDVVSILVDHLEDAHVLLTSARKIAALNGLESYVEIGDAIECVEAALVWHTN